VEYVLPAGARDDFSELYGADWIDALSRYDGLRAVRRIALGTYAAGLSETYVPAEPAAPARGLQVLPNLDVVALGDLAPADRLVLDAFADRINGGNAQIPTFEEALVTQRILERIGYANPG